jgi:hypothetical protein
MLYRLNSQALRMFPKSCQGTIVGNLWRLARRHFSAHVYPRIYLSVQPVYNCSQGSLPGSELTDLFAEI